MEITQIKQFSIFSNISDEEIKYFQEITKEVKISKGDIFISEGNVGDSIYMLVEGEVEVNQALTLSLNRKGNDNREKALIKLNSNQTPPPLFGEMSICDAHPSTGYKVMLALCRLLCRRLVNANENVLKLTTAFSLVLER